MHPIIVPTINNNDTQALLVEWLKPEGSSVQKGDLLAILETTKSTYDLKSEVDGLLHHTGIAGQEYAFGATLGAIFASAEERDAALAAPPQPGLDKNEGGLAITKSAADLIRQFNITDEQLRSLGKSVIKAKDLDPILASQKVQRNPSGLALSPQQQGVARMVSRSHATVPKSVVVKKIYCDRAIALLADRSKASSIVIALPDLFVNLLGALPEKFPFFFGSLCEDLTFNPSAEANVGVTFDVGEGVFIPVIKNVGSMTLEDVARQMMLYRMKAIRNNFKSEDLSGGAISLSINNDKDTVYVDPILPSNQTCMLSLGALLSELFLDDKGQLGTRQYVFLAAAFDHRAINGHQANAFLNALKLKIEN